jgi:hypothetical protein
MRLPAFVLTLACCAPALAGTPAMAPLPTPVPTTVSRLAHGRVHFDYHSGFLMNLHHTLYNLAMHPKRAYVFLRRATPAEAADMRAALAFYRARYRGRDLLFDDGMAAIKRALSVDDDARRDPHGLGLPAGLDEALARAAPAYARMAWADDDAVNRAWIERARELDARYGAAVQAAVERGLGAGFPAQPVRIDLVGETGVRQGGYTDTQIVIPAGRPSYQDLASLEMLYHEAAHVESSGRLEKAIAAQAAADGRDTDSQLWHVLQFYTVGAAVTEVLARDHLAYVQYAEREGLYKGPFAPYVPMIAADWKPWLAGREGWQDAIEHMVARLPAAH